jgi:Cu2+-exporting ATPase
VRLGRPDHVVALHGKPLPEAAQSLSGSGDTVIALGDEAGWIALFRLGDDPRPEAAALVAALRAARAAGGAADRRRRPAARRVALALGIDEVEANASPQAKHDYVRRLQAGGAVVAMVGDGVNDAPVLAQAQVSVAMGGGSQLARTQADLVLLSENLDHLRRGILVARSFAARHPAEPVVVVRLQSGRPAAGDDRLHHPVDGRHRHVRQFLAGGREFLAAAEGLPSAER